MKIITGSEQSLEALLTSITSLSKEILINIGREVNEDGHLVSKRKDGSRGTSLTCSYGSIIYDKGQDIKYIIHPDSFKGRWYDKHINSLCELITDEYTVIDNFEPTREEI